MHLSERTSSSKNRIPVLVRTRKLVFTHAVDPTGAGPREIVTRNPNYLNSRRDTRYTSTRPNLTSQYGLRATRTFVLSAGPSRPVRAATRTKAAREKRVSNWFCTRFLCSWTDRLRTTRTVFTYVCVFNVHVQWKPDDGICNRSSRTLR